MCGRAFSIPVNIPPLAPSAMPNLQATTVKNFDFDFTNVAALFTSLR